MTDTTPISAPLEERLLVEIEAWNWNLHVGLCSDLTPPDQRFQGGLSYGRSFDVRGLIRAPRNLQSKTIWVWILPFGPDLEFGPDDDVGQVSFRNPTAQRGELRATLLVPESAISTMATGFASTWKYIHIFTFDDDGERASIARFSFSPDIDDTLRPWVGAK
ncbi:MAG TPA: hypothetical protein VNW53_07825 [Phenylobacterium sp.]|jgi:hypothetical protein|uniref:hypothetical protein n=1 Tax=Phenylobacterium sp. TaxID=1871053 RepID=UPI002C0CA0FF|nr:hypothetical protein [Phenylobacterium sp.]HXA38890.1 hypothetical protein [Phenylobacterium sp.]